MSLVYKQVYKTGETVVAVVDRCCLRGLTRSYCCRRWRVADVGARVVRRALGAEICFKRRNSWETGMIRCAFGEERAERESDSRIVKVTTLWQSVRLRSEPIWAQMHWSERSILCPGKECPMCAGGFPRRGYFFCLVDRPGNAVATLQLTERDLQCMNSLDREAGGGTRIGSQFRVRRTKSRQPMELEFVGYTANMMALPLEHALVDLLRIHGVSCTEGDVRTGGHQQLVRERALVEAARSRRHG